MVKKTYRFSNAAVNYYFDSSISDLRKLTDRKNTIVITDERVYKLYSAKFKTFRSIVIPSGEKYKTQETVDNIIEELIGMQADRNSFLVGIGGGVVTDITGYVASIYMRGIKFGFVPSTLLAMVDAAIGGKNGVDSGGYKNLVGTINQPEFLLYDTSLLQSLPEKEWRNGFAEIIKHACIKNAAMFRELQENNLEFYKKKKNDLKELIRKNVLIKTKIVQEDEFESGDRKLLNFGHTAGHAIEMTHNLPHGYAVALGMIFAASVSEELLNYKDKDSLIQLLKQYKLPVRYPIDTEAVKEVLVMDKKRTGKEMNFILLKRTGKALIHPIPVNQLQKFIAAY